MKTKILDFFWIPIGVASFFVFSSQFYPLLNSDDALNILMIKDLKFPQDLYAWGQDRGGALIPFLGWPLHHIFGISVILSESIVHYLILFLGFWCLSRVLKSRVSQLIFSLVWFFPPYWFFSLIRFPFGLQYALTGIALYLILIRRPEFGKSLKDSLCVIVSILALSLALWVSDLAWTNIIALLLIIFIWLKGENVTIRHILKKPEFYISIISFVLVFLFLLYAKNQAVKTEPYNNEVINNFKQIWESLITLLFSLWQIITFQRETFLLSVFGILAILLIITLLLSRPKPKKEQQLISLFFLLDSFILLLIIILSHWAYLNGDSRRYFVGMYIGIALIILILIENSLGIRRKLLQSFALITVIIAAISSFHYLKTVYPKSLKPMVNIVGEFEKLGEIGVISEYWNSYITACPDPYKIAAVPHDRSSNRNPDLVDEVFSKPRLFIIKDKWFNEFPDTLYQYGYKLKRKGAAFEIGNCIVNEYEKVLQHRFFYPKDLLCIKDQIKYDSISARTMVYADSTCLECKEKHLVYGPGITLGKGKYQIKFFLRFDEIVENMDLAILDVAADFGRIKLSNKVVHSNEASTGIFQYFQLDFEIFSQQKNIEFRLLYLGNSKVCFDHLILQE